MDPYIHDATQRVAGRVTTVVDKLTGKATSILNNSLITGVTSVVLVGNPGAGKSTLLTALGGNFPRGFSAVGGLTTRVSTQQVVLRNRSLRLVDMPGIYDADQGEDNVIDRNLRMLHETLNDGGAFVVFFVISPRNGRIDASDLALMKVLLDNMKKGPLVGMILTQVKQRHHKAVQSQDFYSQVHGVLTQANADLRFLEKHDALVLLHHDDQFSEQDLYDIHNYVLSFTPRQVEVRNLVASILVAIFGAIILIIKGIVSY